MKATLTLAVLSLLVLSVVPGVLATSVGGSITPDITTEDFAPLVWMCDQRIVFDDHTEPGRITGPVCADKNGDGVPECELVERINNYAFEGEQIEWIVLVMDKNGIDKVVDVYATIGSSQEPGNDIEVNCQQVPGPTTIPEACNARILEEELTVFDPAVMGYFECTFTVETSESMYGEYWVTVEAQDFDGLLGTMDENEYWFLNPVIALSIDGNVAFDTVRPGTASYSDTILVGNDADAGSGVLMDMFISGTDFYDSSSSGAMCPVTNQLALSAFRYFATSGAYSTYTDAQNNVAGVVRNRDAEGYVNIDYGIGFNDPTPFYNDKEIMQVGPAIGPYYAANILAPGAEMAVTFKLDLPEPCNGDFDTGSIFFWGEAI